MLAVVGALGAVAYGAPARLSPQALLHALLAEPVYLGELPGDYSGCGEIRGGGVPGLARHPSRLGGAGILAFGRGAGSAEIFYVVYPNSTDARLSVEHPDLQSEPVTETDVQLHVLARQVPQFPSLPGVMLAGTNPLNGTTITVASVADGPALTVAWTTNDPTTNTAPGPLLASAEALLRRIDRSNPKSQRGATPRADSVRLKTGDAGRRHVC